MNDELDLLKISRLFDYCGIAYFIEIYWFIGISSIPAEARKSRRRKHVKSFNFVWMWFVYDINQKRRSATDKWHFVCALTAKWMPHINRQIESEILWNIDRMFLFKSYSKKMMFKWRAFPWYIDTIAIEILLIYLRTDKKKKREWDE